MSLEFSIEIEKPNKSSLAFFNLYPKNPFYTLPYITSKGEQGYSTYLLSLKNNDRILSGCVGFMKQGRVNKVFEIESAHSELCEDIFWDGLMQFCKREKVTQLIINSFGSENSIFTPRSKYEITRRNRTEYLLDLTTDSLWDNISKNHKRNIKRAQKKALKIIQAKDMNGIKNHASLINAPIKRRIKRNEEIAYQTQTKHIESMLKTGASRIYQCVDNGEVLSSILLIVAERGAYYQSAGTNTIGMQCGASQFLIYELSELLKKESFEVFNLGGADECTPGLVRFKMGFGPAKRHHEFAEYFLGGFFKKHIFLFKDLLSRYMP